RRLTMKPDPKFNGRYVHGAGGTRLFVEDIGDRARPSILWLHAYCQCRLSWDKQFASDLTKQFHLVRMDLRGHGLSDKPSDPEAFKDGKRSEEHTSELQSRGHLVCRLLLEKKK